MGKFNGFGKINRLVARVALQRDHVELIRINDLFITTDYTVHYHLPYGVSRSWKERHPSRHYGTSGPAGGCQPINAQSNDDLQMLHSVCQKITRARDDIAEMSADRFVQTSGDRSGHRFVHHRVVLRLDRVMGTSSHGTTIFHGTYCNRCVAVKRLVRGHCEVAKGIHVNLLDWRHPNVVLYEPVIENKDFTYICQDLCDGNLTDLVRAVSRNVDLPAFSNVKYELWTAPGHRPSSLLLKLMREMTLAVAHLHGLNIIHGDIKPENVLITSRDTLSAKLTNMGIIKCLQEGNSIWENRNSEWRGPEILRPGERPTREVDIFCLGCVFFFCVTSRIHAKSHESHLNGLACETRDLVLSLLYPRSKARPTASEVLKHPAFWNPEMRLSFLRDVSDWLELEPLGSQIFRELERQRVWIFGRSWHDKVHPAIMKTLIRQRPYYIKSVVALLRAIRNRYSHHMENPLLQAIEGPVPEGFDSYYSKQFPRLLMVLYDVVSLHWRSEVVFRKYFSK